MDTPPRLATRRGNTLGETVSIAEQLIVLRENFLRIPTAEKEEQYCAYHLVDATWGLSRYTLFNIITKWIAKRCSGYLLLPCRILGTMAAIIIFFSYLYIVFALNVPGRLVFSNGEPIFQNGVLYGIGRSLYFSIVTFSTLGYGDIHPVGLLKGFAAVEAFLGLVVMGVFVVSLARKLFRW